MKKLVIGICCMVSLVGHAQDSVTSHTLSDTVQKEWEVLKLQAQYDGMISRKLNTVDSILNDLEQENDNLIKILEIRDLQIKSLEDRIDSLDPHIKFHIYPALHTKYDIIWQKFISDEPYYPIFKVRLDPNPSYTIFSPHNRQFAKYTLV